MPNERWLDSTNGIMSSFSTLGISQGTYSPRIIPVRSPVVGKFPLSNGLKGMIFQVLQQWVIYKTHLCSKKPEGIQASWWLKQPIWKIWVKMGSSSLIFGVKIINSSNHHQSEGIQGLWLVDKIGWPGSMQADKTQEKNPMSCGKESSSKREKKWLDVFCFSGLLSPKINITPTKRRPSQKEMSSYFQVNHVKLQGCKPWVCEWGREGVSEWVTLGDLKQKYSPWN